MADTYTLTIIVQGEDHTAPAVQGMERLGVGGIAAGNLLANAMQSAAGAVMGFASDSITAAGDFQQSMSVLQAASGATAAQMDQMRTLAVALGNDMALPGANAQDAATAMLDLSKAGLTVNDSMAAAKGTLQLAAAAETDAATAAQVVSGALNAFGLSGEHATEIADQLAAGANASAASITDLSQGFQAAGFAFNATGQHTDDLITSLSMLTNVGLTGSDAGTALKNAMMQLMAPTDAAAKTMSQYSINVRDAQGNMLPFRDIIGMLQTQLGGLSEAQKDAALKTILQGDGMKAMLPLIDAGVAGFDAMKAKVNEAGAAQNMAAAQMQGLNGAMGGLSNAVETLQLIIGTALLPVITAFITMVADGVNQVTTFVQALLGSADAFAQLGPIAQFAVSALQAIGQIFTDLGSQAMAWGYNLMDQFGAGIMAAAGAVIDAVMQIGSIIASWLMPGSPPKILPDLDQWGTEAANVYMEGWGQADYSVFNSIGDAIKGALDGIAKATGDKNMNVAAMVIGSQDDIAKAISEIHNLGSVSEGTFNSIIAAAGPAGPQVSGLVHAYLDLESATQDVARAQDELNRITEDYASKLDPMKAQLKGIQDQKANIQDAQKLAKLQDELASGTLSDQDAQLKMLEVQEIQLRQNIRATESERDTAVDAAKQKLDAAKAQQAAAKQQVDAEKARLDAMNKSNALIAQQTKAMAGAAGVMGHAAGAIAAHGGALDAVKGPLQAVNILVDKGTAAYTGATTAASTMATTVQSTVSPAFQAFQSALAPVGAFISANLMPILIGLGAALTAVIIPALVSVGVAAVGMVASFVLMIAPLVAIGIAAALLYSAFQTNFLGLQTIIQPVIDAVVNGFGQGGIGGAFAALLEQMGTFVPQIGTWLMSVTALIVTQVASWGTAFVAWLAPYIPIVLTALGAFLVTLGGWIISAAFTIGGYLLNWGMAFVDWIAPYVAQALVALGAFAASIGTWIVAQTPVWLVQLAAWGMAFVTWITPYANAALVALGGFALAIAGWIVQQAPGFIGQLLAWGQAFIGWIGPMIPPAIAALGGLASAFLGWIGAQAAPIIAQLGVWAQAFLDWIPGATVAFLAAWPGMLSGFLDWIGSAAGPILAQLALWASAFLGWIGPMIPPFLAQIGAMIPPLLIALAGIALAIVTWVAETAVVIVAKVASWAGAMLGWIGANVLPALPGLLAGIVTAITSFIGSAVKSLLSEGAKIGTAVVDGIKQGLSSAWGKVTAWLAEKVASIPAPIRQIMGIHSPSAVMADLVGAPIVDGIAMGIKTASPKAVGAMLDLASKLIDVVSRGVDAFGKLSQLGTIPQGAVQRFADSIMGALTVFSAMTQTWDKASMSAASQFTKKAGDVVDMLAKGVDFLLKLQTLQAIPAQAIHAFVSALDLTMRELVAISTQQMRIGLMGAVEFAGGAGKLLEVVGKGVESLSKLSTFQAVPLTAFLAFRAALKSAIYTFTQAVQEWSTAPIASAAAFADSSGKMLDVIGKGAESLSKLAEFAGVPLAAFMAFRANLKSAIYTFTQAAAEWAGAPVGAAVQFAQTSATILDTIGKGIDGLTKLRGFEGTPLAAFVSFRAALAQAVATMIAIAQSFAASAVDAAGTFATSAGKVVGIIGSAVDGFTKLAAFEGVTDAAFVDFGSALFYTIDLFVAIAADWDAKAVEAAGVFATGAGKVVGIIGNGVEGLTKLADLKPVAQSSIQLFVAMTNDLMIRIGAAASGFSADALAAAGKFADAAGKTVGILKNGVDGFLTVDTFTGVSQAAINRFADGVRMAVTAMAAMATSFGADAVAAANTFAKAAGESTDFLKKGVEGFNKLTELEGVPAAGLKVFADTVVALIQTTIKLGTLISNEMIAEATRIANGTDQVIEVVKNAIKAFLTLGEATGQLPNYIQGFVTAVAELMADFQRAVLPPAQNIGAAISLGIAAGITSQAGAIQNAVYAAVNQALAAARAALGIASPSKVFEQQIGLQMSAGMAKGVLGGMGGVQAAVSQVSGGAIGGVGSTTNNNQRTFAPGAIQIQVIAGDSKNARAMADEVATELERRLGLVG